MNDKFFELPEEKRLRIINAALEIFSLYEYKRASTDDIAAKAGVSKGLLFYYFHNKKELYRYLFDYCVEIAQNQIIDEKFSEITDFFELMDYGAEKKLAIISKMPYIADFSTRAFYSKDEPVSEIMQDEIIKKAALLQSVLIKNIDLSKFKPGISPGDLVQMLTWISDGYLHEKMRSGQFPNFNEMMNDYRKWMNMFKKIYYREEYLNERD